MRKDKIINEVLGEEAALSPSDLYSKEFKRAFIGGYDPTEVDEFLERAADILEMLIVQQRDLKERNEEQRKRLEEYHEMESTLRSALVSSQKLGADLVESSKRLGESIVHEAKAEKAALEAEMARTGDKMLPAFREELLAELAGQRQTLQRIENHLAELSELAEDHES